MRKSYYTVLLLLNLPLILLAQPTITRDWVGEPGDVTGTVQSEVIPDISPAGENAYWDFTNVIQDSITMKPGEFLEVENTPFPEDFPNANTCLKEGSWAGLLGYAQDYQYGRVSDSLLELQGNRVTFTFGEGFAWGDVYSDPRMVLAFPFSFGSVADDDYQAEGTMWIFDHYTHGTVHFVGDSYGTVDLPNGRLENCLRIAFHETKFDSMITDAFTTRSISDISGYMWITPDKAGTMAYYSTSVVTSTTFREGEIPETEVSLDTIFTYNPLVVVGVAMVETPSVQVSVMPNPFRESVNFEFQLDRSGEVRLEIFSVNGQLLFNRRLDGVNGINRVEVDLGQVEAGNLVAILSTPDGAVPVKLVKAD